MHFYRSFFSLFPKFHFSQKKFLFVISTHKQQYPLHFYRLFFALFHFSQKKIHFVNSSFLPTNNNIPSTSTDHFLHFCTFPPKKFHFVNSTQASTDHFFHYFTFPNKIHKIPILRLLDEIPFVLVSLKATIFFVINIFEIWHQYSIIPTGKNGTLKLKKN